MLMIWFIVIHYGYHWNHWLRVFNDGLTMVSWWLLIFLPLINQCLTSTNASPKDQRGVTTAFTASSGECGRGRRTDSSDHVSELLGGPHGRLHCQRNRWPFIQQQIWRSAKTKVKEVDDEISLLLSLLMFCWSYHWRSNINEAVAVDLLTRASRMSTPNWQQLSCACWMSRSTGVAAKVVMNLLKGRQP